MDEATSRSSRFRIVTAAEPERDTEASPPKLAEDDGQPRGWLEQQRAIKDDFYADQSNGLCLNFRSIHGGGGGRTLSERTEPG